MKLKTEKIHKVLLLQLLIAVMLLPMQALAAEYQCSVTIPAEVRVTGSAVPSGNEYTIVMERADEKSDDPLPEVTELVIKDGGTVEFGPVTYTRPGDYRYRIYQKAGIASNLSYDKTIYTVTVRVLNDEESGGLRWEMWAVRGSSDRKTDEIRFENRYSKPAEPEEEQHGPDPGDEPKEENSVIPTAVKKPDPQPAAAVPVLPTPDQGASLAGGGQTGDSAYPALWAGFIAAAIFVLTAVLMKRKKNENTEE